MLTAYLIEPAERRIREILIGHGYDEVNAAIGSRMMCVGTYLPEGDTVYVDDEGLLSEEPKDFFRVNPRWTSAGHVATLCGKGVVLGSDREGESVDVKISLEELADAVSWGLADDQAEPQAGFTFIALGDLEVQS
jgi:hypothetical protein